MGGRQDCGRQSSRTWHGKRFNAIVDEIAGLVESALAWLGDGWEFLKGLMRSAFNAAKDAFGNIVFRFLLSPLGFLADALTQLDPAALKKSWATFSSVVTSMADGFKTMAASLLKPFEALWGGINGYRHLGARQVVRSARQFPVQEVAQ